MKLHTRYRSPILFILFCFLSIHSNAQNVATPYNKNWKLVDIYVKNNQPKSALEIVKQIYEDAKKDNAQSQLIKATIYLGNLQNENREDNSVLSISELEKEVATAHEPSKSILINILATAYYQYYQNQRWLLYNRTQTVDFKKEDIATWGMQDFHEKIGSLYMSSLQSEEALKKTKLSEYDAIITKGNVQKLRPTLFDLLAFKALEYFSSNERNIKKAAYSFELNTSSAFLPASEFIQQKFETRDTTSLEFHALLIYQKLLAFHIHDKELDALIDADIARLQFVNQKSVHPETSRLYYAALHHLADQYGTSPAAAQAWFLTGQWHQGQGEEYNNSRDSTLRFEKQKAVAIYEKVVKENPETEGGMNAFNALIGLRQKTFQLTTEKVNIPDLPFRVLVDYTNMSQLSFKLVKVTEKIKAELTNGQREKVLAMVKSATSIRNWQQNLPDPKDLQSHTAEIKVDALPVGEYVLLASSHENFSDSKASLGYTILSISNISYINRGGDYFVLDRNTGQPLAGATVQIWNQVYNAQQYRNDFKKRELYTTDQNGYFKKKSESENNRNRNFRLEITYKKDKLFDTELNYDYYNFGQIAGQKESRIYVFTDRSIYRPGQTVYYKGIVTGEKEVITGQNVSIVLQNANGEQVDKVSRLANDYGTFSGKFQLPQGVLNGVFNIVVDQKHFFNFRVEEYKRPKFLVEYAPIKTSYQINDKILIEGAANAYAGNTISEATVKYRVVRNQRPMYPWLWKRGYLPISQPTEITHGETTTDANGKFKIEFQAIPDLSVSKKIDPVFDYTVYADVTDLNGETRSAEKSVSVTYKSILLQLDLPETLVSDSLKSLAIRSENTNGEFVATPLDVKIYKLKAEQRLIRPRYWDRPDQFVMSKSEYIKLFPNDEYDNETDQNTWPREKLFFEKKETLEAGKKLQLNKLEKLPAGIYQVEILAKDKNGEEVKLVKNVALTNPLEKQLTTTDYLWKEGSKPIEPGQTTAIKLGSSAGNLFVVQGLITNNDAQTTQYSFFKLNNEKRSFEFNAKEEDRGGYGVTYLFVKHNRFFEFTDKIDVPWSNKDLRITYETHRDKTLPGSHEKWKVKITGNQKEKVAAEMLASMYDASLDQFYPHAWTKPGLWPSFYNRLGWVGRLNFGVDQSIIYAGQSSEYKHYVKIYDRLIEPNYGTEIAYKRNIGGSVRIRGQAMPAAVNMEMDKNALEEVVTVGYGQSRAKQEVKKDEDDSSEPGKPTTSTTPQIKTPQIRKNFNETAFWLPDLRTNEQGEIEFSFTMPDALTRWKFQALTHTKELALGYSSLEIVTQKDLMVQPNPPRFLREGDQIEFSSKITNLTDKSLSGTVTFQLFNPETNQPIDDAFGNKTHSVQFKAEAKQGAVVKFPLTIPKNYAKTVIWRITAKAGSVSDGEENVLPVLPNRMLVTETMPLTMRGSNTKLFKFHKLVASDKSSTLSNHSLTIEYTSNPAWYAIQALPYLMEYPYECAEQTWNRYYANALASNIANSSPKIAKVFESWKLADTTALMSNLQKNEELKSLLLQETPWVMQGKSESEQKRNVAILFDLIRMGKEQKSALEKLQQMQISNGGFVWFKGGADDRYMTQYIVTGIGHLFKLKASSKDQSNDLKSVLNKAIPYLDLKIKQDYDDLLKSKMGLKDYVPSSIVIQYLYMRSFFPDYKIATASQKAVDFFTERSRATWTKQNKYMQGMIALSSHRMKDSATPKAILKSLKETAIRHEELGMYWKNTQSWWWYDNSIERQALLIEAFQEIQKDVKTADDLKTWLLKNKQTNRWESTKSTAEACYALLLQGTEWLSVNPETTIQLGSTVVKSSDEKQEAGTGYFKKTIPGENVNASMGNIKVSLSNTDKGKLTTSWGAVYWQYFEDLDKITFAETPLKIVKKLFVETNSESGPVITPIEKKGALKVGDKVKVRIELRVDRDMEYVHMKDMRASSLEPVNVLSQYKWQGGLGYYESTKDASTNFFFNHLRKGTYVFEYPLFVTHAGNFSNGITTIQCMYAPEFTAHSEGVRIAVEAK